MNQTTDVTDVTVMIPALNEEANLEATVSSVIRARDQVDGLSLEIIIVNDGSTDQTPQLCEQLAQRHDCIRVIHNHTNKGVGTSLRDALQIATGEKFVIIPGDNDMSYELILSLFQNTRKADLVLCFYLNREMRGRLRNIISALFGLIYMSVFNIFVQYITGPCIYPTSLVRDLKLVSTRFSIPTEITIKLLRKGVTFHEIPGYMQTGLKGSDSSPLSLKNSWEVITTFLRLVYEIKWAKRHEYSKAPIRQVLYVVDP